MAFTAADLQAALDPSNTGRTCMVQKMINGPIMSDVYVVGVTAPYAGKSQWVQISAASTAVQAATTVNQALGVVAPTPIVIGTLRQVATSTHTFDSNVTNAYVGCKSPHFARDNITSLQFLYTNWRGWAGNGEQDGASTCSVTACIEYPVGTKTQFTFGGVRTGTVAPGANLIPDALPIFIPKDAKFWIYIRSNGASGHCYFAHYAGDGSAQLSGANVASNVADLTLTGSTGDWLVIASTEGAYMGPAIIMANSTVSAVALNGDSKSQGATDISSGQPFQGHLGRAFSAYAHSHLGTFGDTVAAYNGTHVKRLALSITYFTHSVHDFGINGITAGETAATSQANFNTYLSYFTSKPLAALTLSPVTPSSTDGWTTVGGQTIAPTNGVRVAVNTQRMTNLPLVNVLYDITPAVESGVNPESGFWAAPSGVALTRDGTHLQDTGSIAAAAAIDPLRLLSRPQSTV